MSTMHRRRLMSTANIIRFACILLLWLALCYIYLKVQPTITLMSLFWIVASGIIVFVPLYKKYVKKSQDNDHGQ